MTKLLVTGIEDIGIPTLFAAGLAIFLMIITSIVLIRADRQGKRERLDEERRQAFKRRAEKEYLQKMNEEVKQRRIIDKKQNALDDNLPLIKEAARRVLFMQSGYIASYPCNQWYKEYHGLYDMIASVNYSELKVDAATRKAIGVIISFFDGGERMRGQHNERIISEDLIKYSYLLDTAAGKPLDSQQRRAIITDEDNNLILAGAGSGKTTTIVGKVKYLIKRYKIKPHRILLITFTSKSAESLAEKVDVKGIAVKTFHSFCLGLVSQVLGYKPSVFEADGFDMKIRLLLEDRFMNDSEYKKKAVGFFIDDLKIERQDNEFKTHGEYIQYLKEQNYKPLKAVLLGNGNKQSLKREIVKSKEECKIANFLYLNNVDYLYEAPYVHRTATNDYRQYQPDFTIRQGEKLIYLEHFGINKDEKVPDWFAKNDTEYSRQLAQDEYKRGMKWKRDTHKHHGTTLIETYSYESDKRNGLLINLTKKLQKAGIELNPKSPEEIWDILKRDDKNGHNSFVKLIGTFITLTKSNNVNFIEIRQRVKSLKLEGERTRALLFCDIVEPIYDDYQAHLVKNGLIDFSDMINTATQYVQEGDSQQPFDYIIIDEFQDTSMSRYRLIESLKNKNPYCKLFCVGDDWQSIYRFAGSDISLIKRFKSYFGVTEELKIETTYRYHEPLIKASGDFILKNPNQSIKELKSGTPNKLTTYHIKYFDNFTKEQDALTKLDELISDLMLTYNDINNKEILLLGRYSFDKNILEESRSENSMDVSLSREKSKRKGLFRIIEKTGTNETVVTYTSLGRTVSMKFMSVHKAKGLEADVVIIINCSSGAYGFPSQLSDDPVLNLLLSSADQFENGEERRLFYVAMTRAKDKVYFLTDKGQKSKFITEFETTDVDSQERKCPRCIQGDLVLRTGSSKNSNGEYAFYGCSNFGYGCGYTRSTR